MNMKKMTMGMKMRRRVGNTAYHILMILLIVEEIVLQDTVRCPQDFLPFGGQKRIALLIQSNF